MNEQQARILGELKQLLGEMAGSDLTDAPTHASFFDLGFDSLFLTQASHTLRQRFGVKITFRQLLEELTTLETMTAYLAEHSAAPALVKAPAPATQPSCKSATDNSNAPASPLIERILDAQRRVMEQQLALLRTFAPPAAPEPSPAPAGALTKTPANAFGPFRPIDSSASTGFTERQQRHLDQLIARYTAKTPESKRRTQAQRRHFSDPRSVSGFRPFWKEMVYPIVTVRSEGARFWDVDGNEFLDVTMGFGTNLLGHAPKFITEALEAQLKRGIEVGPQSPLAGDVAALLCELTRHERAAFCNTGSEAVLAAIRIARTVTGRTRIATAGGFHGICDEVLVRANVVNGVRRSVPVAPGIPEHVVRDVLVLDYGSEESLELLREHAHELAAVLIEPVQSRHPDLQPREFLHEVRRITTESETALIFDEVINGFRCHLHGAQEWFGVKSDIGTWGKIIGGGMPIGAVTGCARFMDALDGGDWQFGDGSFPEVGVTFFAGTYVRHPLAMAASHAMLTYLKEQGPGLQRALNERTTRFVARLNDFLREQGAPLQLEHFSSLFYLHFGPEVKYGSLLYFHLREKGLHIWEGRPCFLSTAHTDADIEEIFRIFCEGIAELQQGGFLPEAPANASQIALRETPRSIEIAAPAPPLSPAAAARPLDFSLYFFGDAPAEYHEDKYRIIIEGAKFADIHGFTAVWLPERHFHTLGGFSPNPSVLAAALARETHHVQLRAGSVVLPLHHPVRVAEEWAMVDNLSGGRTGISIASGWHPNDFVFAPEAFEERRELCFKGLDVIQRLWRGEAVEFATGGQKRLPVTLHPMPKQHELPVWLTCIHKDTFVKAGELGVGVLGYLMNQTLDEVAEKIALYRESLARHGHLPEKGRVTILAHTFVAAGDDRARSVARGPMREYIRSFLDNSQKRLASGGAEVAVDRDEVEYLLDRAFADYMNGKALIGSPAACAETARRLRDIGVDEVGCFVDFGIAPHTVLAHFEHLAALKELCSRDLAPTQVSHSKALPLADAQRGLWVIAQLSEDAARAYNEGVTLELRGPLDQPALERALQALVDRHEALRTSFAPDGETQIVHPHAALALHVEDFTPLDPKQCTARLREFERIPFDFTQPPLFRALLAKLAPDHHQLVLIFHHLLGNGPSYWVLFDELTALYTTSDPSSLEAPLQLSEFVRWRREQTHEEDEAFWLTQLSGEVPSLQLPVDRPRLAVKTFRGGRCALRFAPAFTSALRATGAQHRSSLFMVLFAACKAWLHRLSGDEDIIIGVPFESGARELPGGERLFANTTNMLPLRTQIAPGQPFAELLAATKSQVLTASEHQEYFFGNLLPKLSAAFDPSRPPVFAVTFNFESGRFVKRAGATEFRFITDDVPYRSARDIAAFDLVLNIAENDGELRLECDYNADLFDAATIERWLAHYHTLLRGVCANPATRIGWLPLLDAPERNRMLDDWNPAAAPIPADSVHEMVRAQVARTPLAIAVECETQQLTYAELDLAASNLGAHLQALGAAPGQLIGVCVERSIAMLIAVLGVWKTGAAYVPLDPAFPPARLAMMSEDAALALIITQPEGAMSLPANTVRLVNLGSLPEKSLALRPVKVLAEGLAYVLFTSGSTGRPKGVEITHRALANFLASMRRKPGLASSDTVLAVTTLSFDIAGLELFLPLITGAKVAIATQETAADANRLLIELERSRATVMQATPATWRALLSAGWSGSPKLKALIGGEAAPADLVAQLLPSVGELWNMYGPTETTIWSTIQRLESAELPIAIGRPIANTRAYVLNSALEPQPIGVPGELHLGGAGLARGYFGQPELTAEKFIASPFTPGERLYKTGDLARFLLDGRIECLGRLDGQVKIRGFRIERGDIEAALRRHPSVRQAAVVVRRASSGDDRLVAYCTPRNGAAPDEFELRRHVAAHLPAYMVPNAFITLAELPLTPNGKVDLKALPDFMSDSIAPRAVAPAENPLQADLIALWEEVLERRPIGIRDSFFELGGHSLLAMRLLARIAGKWRVTVPLRRLFETPVLADIAAAIEAAPRKDEAPAASRILPVARRRREAAPVAS